jgi:hypothetical protein
MTFTNSDKTTADTIMTDVASLPVKIINTIASQMIEKIGYFKTT